MAMSLAGSRRAWYIGAHGTKDLLNRRIGVPGCVFNGGGRTAVRPSSGGPALPHQAKRDGFCLAGFDTLLMTGTGTSFQNGLIRTEIHNQIEEATRAGIDVCVSVGCPNLIAIPGERRGMSREQGADNAVAILNRVKGYAEQKGITLCMEITNSKVAADQRTDQVFDHMAWGLDVCKRVNSPRVKIVYDMYHVQIADGDVTRTLRDNFDHVCHIHVAGVPSRQEIDDTQELNYRFIANAIADLGYSGFVAHEWRPAMGNDPVKSLERCFEVLNV
jgi:hydroxypyruvate isomerase